MLAGLSLVANRKSKLQIDWAIAKNRIENIAQKKQENLEL